MDAAPEVKQGPPAPLRMAPAGRLFTRVHLVKPGSQKTLCRKVLRPEDLWAIVPEDTEAPVCRRCRGLPPLPPIETMEMPFDVDHGTA
jgi:hypothetical protein